MRVTFFRVKKGVVFDFLHEKSGCSFIFYEDSAVKKICMLYVHICTILCIMKTDNEVQQKLCDIT